MSDKFFFKGRQDARENHVKHSFEVRGNANKKAGTKKYPLSLVVTSESRMQEVQTLVDDANLYAEITVDDSVDATESIGELTVILNKTESVKISDVPARNDPCSCGSGKKYKKCCG